MLIGKIHHCLRTLARQKHVRVACASGFWGDTSMSTPQLIMHTNPIPDFIIYDYLSEITMSLLARAKSKDASLGYCSDFVAFHVTPYLYQLKSQGVKVVSNAGGLNPVACANALLREAEEQGVELMVAAITGDDLRGTPAMERLSGDLERVPRDSLVSVNAYLGAEPIRQALDLGADIVVTGRCVDSALALGPLMHTFGWKEGDLKELSAGSLAGHLLECGAQATGGIFTDWSDVPDWHQIGFPIVDFADSSPETGFHVTKPQKTGGLVNFGTVAEQLVYEIGDPADYMLPDVRADWTQVHLEQDGKDSVLVRGARGRAPTDQYKVTATFLSNYRCIAVCPILGGRAGEKGRATAEAILKRCQDIFHKLKLGDFTRTNIQIVGAGECYGAASKSQEISHEAVIWLAVEHRSKQALQIFSREIAPAGTGMAPGLCGIVGGRPSVSPVLRHLSCLVPKADVDANIHMNGELVLTCRSVPDSLPKSDLSAESAEAVSATAVPSGSSSHRLETLCFGRSGDKGDTCNIGVVCRDPAYFPVLRSVLTAELVAEYFAHFLDDPRLVQRYELPGISAFNFVLPKALGGGGVASLRVDPQGKAYAQMLLDMELSNMPSLEEMRKS